MNIWQKIAVGFMAGAAWAVAVWVAFAYPTLAAQMAEVKMVAQGVLGGLGLYHLIIAQPPNDKKAADAPANTTQSGFANPFLLGVIALAIMFAVGRVFITPRLTGIPTIEGGYEALAHLFVGFLIFVPFYDRKQLVGPSKVYGAIGWFLGFWEFVWFLIQKFFLVAAVATLASCSNAAIQRDTKLAGEVAVDSAAVAIDIIATVPDQTTTETRTCTKDRNGSQTCTTTQQSN